MEALKHTDSTSGTESGKKQGYPGREETKVGVLRLYELTQDPLPLKLARYFILQRGQRDDKGGVYFAKAKDSPNALWRDLEDKNLYITRGIGSVRQWEGFGDPYVLLDLESEGCHAETYATFALINWSQECCN